MNMAVAASYLPEPYCPSLRIPGKTDGSKFMIKSNDRHRPDHAQRQVHSFSFWIALLDGESRRVTGASAPDRVRYQPTAARHCGSAAGTRAANRWFRHLHLERERNVRS